MAPIIVEEIRRLLERLKQAGTTMVLVEQNMPLASRLVDRFIILRDGVTVAQGSRRDLAEKFEGYVATHYV